MVRSMMSYSDMPNSFGDNALETAAYICLPLFGVYFIYLIQFSSVETYHGSIILGSPRSYPQRADLQD